MKPWAAVLFILILGGWAATVFFGSDELLNAWRDLDAKKSENDSLQAENAGRQARIDRLTFRLDSSVRWYDSALKVIPPPETLYLGHRAQAATLDYRRMWSDMGRIPADTAAH